MLLSSALHPDGNPKPVNSVLGLLFGTIYPTKTTTSKRYGALRVALGSRDKADAEARTLDSSCTPD